MQPFHHGPCLFATARNLKEVGSSRPKQLNEFPAGTASPGMEGTLRAGEMPTALWIFSPSWLSHRKRWKKDENNYTPQKT
jgi:hypothetical protein